MLKVVSTPKHYAVHSGPEPQRHVFDARVSDYDLQHTCLAAFRATVMEGKAGSVMCVYLGGRRARLRQRRSAAEGAVNDIVANHHYTATQGAAAVAAVKAGTDLTCGTEYRTLVDEVKAGNISEAARGHRKAIRFSNGALCTGCHLHVGHVRADPGSVSHRATGRVGIAGRVLRWRNSRRRQTRARAGCSRYFPLPSG